MPTIVMTGASRGIGRVTTLRLAAKGWTVHAGVRSDADGAALVAEGGPTIRPLRLDITSGEDVARIADLGPLDAVVNNAGYVLDGPVEALSLADLRRQFDVNVVGQVAVTQAALPGLRANRGRVVFVSSLSGRVSSPMTGAYNASKYALEGLADALRVELRRWHLPVVLVEPGAVRTEIWTNALEQHDASVARMTPAHAELYAGHLARTRRSLRMMQRLAVPPERVAAVIERALTADRPRARYQVGLSGRVQLIGSSLSPTVVKDALFARALG